MSKNINDRRNITKRRERRRKRKIKPKVKIVCAIILFVLFLGAGIGYKFYLKMNTDPFGKISDNLQEDEGDIEIEVVNPTEYTILDVPGGEAILVSNGEIEALIDTGCKSSSKDLVKALKGKVVDALDYLIITNDSEKRIGGIEAIYKNFTVTKTILGNLDKNKDRLTRLATQNSSYESGTNNSYSLNETMITTMQPKVTSTAHEDKCLVVVVSANGEDLISLSDAGKEEVQRCLGEFERYDVVVLSQQGNSKSNTLLFEENDYAKAEYLVASCSKNSGFPSAELLEDYGLHIFTTGYNGAITFLIDGEGISTQEEEIRN